MIRLTLILLSLMVCACSNRQQENEIQRNEHVEKSDLLIREWQYIKIGSPSSRLAVNGEIEWLEESLIERVSMQVGIWHVRLEDGHSIFRIYPYLNEGQEVPYYQGIILKVEGDQVSEKSLVDSIRGEGPVLIIKEYRILGKNIDIHRK